MMNLSSVSNYTISSLKQLFCTENLLKVSVPLAIANVVNKYVEAPFKNFLVPLALVGATNNIITGTLSKANARFVELQKAINSAVFHYTSGSYASALAHEMGHFIAANAVYKNHSPKIIIYPQGGGEFSFSSPDLTSFGKMLGKDNASTFTMAGGPISGALSASAGLVLGHFFKNKYPEFSSYLRFSSCFTFVTHSMYALSALTTSFEGHDFCALQKAGLHPVAAAVAFIALPLLINQWCDRWQKPTEKGVDKEKNWVDLQAGA